MRTASHFPDSEFKVRSLFKLAVASAPALAVVALLSSSASNIKAVEGLPSLMPQDQASGMPNAKEEELTENRYLIWAQLGQDGSHLALAEALNLPLQTLLHFNGVTKSQLLKRGSWISLPALFKSHLQAYSGPWINPSSLRDEPPESLTMSATLAQREDTVFEDPATSDLDPACRGSLLRGVGQPDQDVPRTSCDGSMGGGQTRSPWPRGAGSACLKTGA